MDHVSTKIYDSGTDEMSLSINGKLNRKEIDRTDFEKEATSLGLGKKLAMSIFDKMTAEFPAALKRCAEELTELGFTEAEPIADRILGKK